MSEDRWRKSSYSGTSKAGECVEVRLGAMVGVRDTKNYEVGTISVPADAWANFLATVLAGPAGR